MKIIVDLMDENTEVADVVFSREGREIGISIGEDWRWYKLDDLIKAIHGAIFEEYEDD